MSKSATSDVVDNAFLQRIHVAEVTHSETCHVPHATNEENNQLEVLPSKTVEEGSVEEACSPDSPPCVHEATVEESDPIVKRLLEKVPGQWLDFAKSIESEVREGRQVIAIVGGVPGEGCSTIARGLVSTLRCRGWDVAALDDTHAIDRQDIFSMNAEKKVVVVDAGAWFPPGPIQHNRISELSNGFDAVVLVRRASKAPSAARATVIRNVGLHLIGEVETFVTNQGLSPHRSEAH